MNLQPTFLIPDETVLLEIVAVLALFAVLARFVLPRLRAAADHRARQVEAAEQQLRQATAERAASRRDAARLITDTRLEAQQILTDARSLRDLILADARVRAHEEYASILARADRAAGRRTASPGEKSLAAPGGGR